MTRVQPPQLAAVTRLHTAGRSCDSSGIIEMYVNSEEKVLEVTVNSRSNAKVPRFLCPRTKGCTKDTW